jgi:hypothetical protein
LESRASAPAADAAGLPPEADGRAAAADVAIAGAILAGLLVRVVAAREKILWFDEFLGGNLVRHSWRTLLPAIRAEAHPPLYYALLKLWCMFFGDGAFGMRSLSVVAGTAAVALLADAVRRSRGGAAGAAAAVLAGLSTVQIDQSSEAKPYAVLALALALLVAAVLRDRRVGSSGSLAALLAAGVAAASVHFYGGAAAGAIAVAAIVTATGRRERARSAFLLAAVLATSAVWLAAALHLDRGAADYIREMWGRVPVWAPFAASTRVALPGWRRPYPAMDGRILPHLEMREVVGAASLVLIVLVAIFAACRARAADPGPPANGRFLALVALALWPGFLAGEVALAAAGHPIAIVGRSEVVVELGVAILAAFAVSRWRRPWLPVAALAAVGVWTVVPQWRPRPGPTGHRWEEVIVRRLLATTPAGGHADVVTLGLARPPLDYYAAGDPRVRFRSFPESQNAHPGWAAHSVSAAERASLPEEAVRLIAFVDEELARGVPVYVAAREGPRNPWLLGPLRRDHDLRPVPWGPGWLVRVERAPVLSATLAITSRSRCSPCVRCWRRRS